MVWTGYTFELLITPFTAIIPPWTLFQNVTFIKIDDEENRALKECIYLKNRDKQRYFEYSTSEHERILQFDLEKYLINPEETIMKEFNYAKKWK